jgi:hypothetical protein
MKFRQSIHLTLLFILPFLITGCYTQFQTYDQFPVEDYTYSSNYSWDEYEGAATKSTQQENTIPDNTDPESDALERELALQEMGIYYQDFETKEWYKDYYAYKLYWQGYDQGYGDGFADGWMGTGNASHYFGYRFNRFRYHIPSYYWRFGHPSFYFGGMFAFGSFDHPAFYAGYYAGYHSNWGYYGPHYYSGYWGNPYYNYTSYYNAYHWSKRYSRTADLYKKGPRNSGMSFHLDSRSRGDGALNRGNQNRIDNGRNGVTRSRSVNTGTRMRGSSGSNGSVGRNRGASVDRSRGNTINSRSRGSNSSVGKRSSNGDSGKSRSRGNDSYQSNFGQTSVRDINISDLRSRTYSIPPRKVKYREAPKRAVNMNDLFRSLGIDRSNYNTNNRSDSPFNSRFNNSNNRSSNSRSIRTNTSRSSSRSTITRSSSKSRSSGTKSRRSSSNSDKRSRGGN